VKRVAVVGAGAIGGFLAAALARAGTSVGVVARGAHLAAIRRDGIRVESDLGTFAVRVDASNDLREFGDLDALLLTFKAHQWPSFREQLDAFAGRETVLVTMQNGLPFWLVRDPPLASVDPGGTIGRCWPDERVVGAVVHVSGEVLAPGSVRQSGGLRYVIGDPRGTPSQNVEHLAELFRRAQLSVEVDSNVRATVWLKLVNNAGLNPTSVLTRKTMKPMLADPVDRERVRELMMEALHVGQAMGIVSHVDVDARIEYASRLNDVKTSMLQDYELRRPLETEPILGAVIELAERCGVAVPRSRAAYESLKRATADFRE
jgi:2-dehydropantoate 2-reductase